MDINTMPDEQVAMLVVFLLLAGIVVVAFIWWIARKIMRSGWGADLSAILSRWGNMVRVSHAAEIEKLRKQVAQHEDWIEQVNGELWDRGTRPDDPADLKLRVKLIEDTLNGVLADLESLSPQGRPSPSVRPSGGVAWPQDAKQTADRQTADRMRDALVRSLLAQGATREAIREAVKNAGGSIDNARISELRQDRNDRELIEQEA